MSLLGEAWVEEQGEFDLKADLLPGVEGVVSLQFCGTELARLVVPEGSSKHKNL
jgi:hypothetical protein